MGRAYDGRAVVLERLAELERLCRQARRRSDRVEPDTPRVELIVHAGRVTVLVRCRALYEGQGGDSATTRRDERAWRYDSAAEALADLPEALEDELDAESPRLAERVDAAMLEGDRLHVAKWRRYRQALDDPAVRRAERLLAGGGLTWQETARNLVVDEGLNDILDKYYKGSSYTASHYVRLTDGSPTFAAGDTLGGTHSGWSEVTAYDESPAPTFSPGTVSGQSVDNSGSPASFSINADSTTIGGGFLATDGTVGGTSGVLVGGAAFSGGDRTLASGDSLDVTATASASSS